MVSAPGLKTFGFAGLAVAKSHKHNIESVTPLNSCQHRRGDWSAVKIFHKHGRPATRLPWESKMCPWSQQCSCDWGFVWYCRFFFGERASGRETETDWTADWSRKTGAETQIESMSGVAKCRADGSWYGRGSGQASAVPSRPHGGGPRIHTLIPSLRVTGSYHPHPQLWNEYNAGPFPVGRTPSSVIAHPSDYLNPAGLSLASLRLAVPL